MTISVVQTAVINNGFSGAFDSNVTIGNSIVLVSTGHIGSGSPVSASNPQYNGGSVTGTTKLIELNDPTGGSAYTSTWLLPNVQSSGTSISITTDSFNGPYVGIFAYEVAGLGASPVLDKSGSSGDVGTTDQTSGSSGNITSSPEFIVGSVVQDNAIGSSYPPAGWTSTNLTGQTAPNLNSVAGYRIAASPGGSYTYDCGAGGPSNWVGSVVTLAASGEPPASLGLLMASFP